MGFNWSGVASAIAGGLMGMSSAKQNAALSKELWQYQQSHAHQLEVEDLRKAGLNPILSATNGQLAGMPSVSGSDYGVGQNIVSALNNAAVVKAQKENKLIDAELEGKRIDNEQAKLNFEMDKFEYEKTLIDAQARNLNTNADYITAKNAREISLNDAQVRQINSAIENQNSLTHAQVSKLYSGIRVDNATIDKIHADTKKVIEDSNLAYWQKTALISSLSDQSAALKRMTAQQQLEYLSGTFGEVQHKTGYGFKLLNPFQGFGFSSSGNYGARF